MRIVIAAVGRLKSGPLADLCAEYCKRIPWPIEIREVEERRPLAASERKRREAMLIRNVLPSKGLIVALDERGKSYDSVAFARQLQSWEATRKMLAFAIGGADGLAPEFADSADSRLALGAMTWPHFFARAMLLEQLYRAASIGRGHPYHRGG